MNYKDLFSKPEDSTKLFSEYDFIEDLFMRYANREIPYSGIYNGLRNRYYDLVKQGRILIPLTPYITRPLNNNMRRVFALINGEEVPPFTVYEDVVKKIAQDYYKQFKPFLKKAGVE